MLAVRATAASEMAMASAIRPTTWLSSSMPLGLLHHPFVPRVPCCAVSLGVHAPADVRGAAHGRGILPRAQSQSCEEGCDTSRVPRRVARVLGEVYQAQPTHN
ncbi:hypothetical protein C8R45DRAFT_1083118, partial [Mycena sanguinolenta]